MRTLGNARYAESQFVRKGAIGAGQTVIIFGSFSSSTTGEGGGRGELLLSVHIGQDRTGQDRTATATAQLKSTFPNNTVRGCNPRPR